VSTRIGERAQELSRLNPWWRDPGWAATDADLVDARNSGLAYRSGVLGGLEPGGLYLLRGPRRVGKTVAVKQKIEDLLAAGTPTHAVVRTAVDGWAAKELRTLAQNTSLPPIPPGTVRYWFLDEVTAVTGNWAEQIKWLRDNDPGFRAATVVLTGSNAAALTDAAGVLAGRRGKLTNLDRTLLPMGFRTFVAHMPTGSMPASPQLPLHALRSRQAATVYESLLPWLDELVRLWELYLAYGGFPVPVAAARAGQPIPDYFVDDMFDVISNDTFAGSRLGALTEMALLERLWKSMASPANLSSIAADVDISADVVTRHVGYLRDAFLLWACPRRADDAWLPRERAQDKLYAIDPVVARLAHLRNPARSDIDPTVLTEMQIGMAVRRRILAERPRSSADESLFYVRTPTRKEIDFVAADLAGVALEGKYTEDGRWVRESATVNASEWDGILATRNVLDTQGPNAWAVPAAFLAFCIDS